MKVTIKKSVLKEAVRKAMLKQETRTMRGKIIDMEALEQYLRNSGMKDQTDVQKRQARVISRTKQALESLGLSSKQKSPQEYVF